MQTKGKVGAIHYAQAPAFSPVVNADVGECLVNLYSCNLLLSISRIPSGTLEILIG